MAKNTISQLDLVLLGRRGLTARLGSVENSIKKLALPSGGDGGDANVQDIRPNLFTNSSFEFFDRGSTKPQDWITAGTAFVSVGSSGSDGTNTLRLGGTATVSQKPAGGVVVPHCSVVISVAARTDVTGQKVAINIIHAPGAQGGAVLRLDQQGNSIQTDDLPPDGNWYRFYRQFILTGGADTTGIIGQAGVGGTIEIDAVKFEKEDGVAAWLEPTAFVAADWGAATHIRNLSAENIITGTLSVGGSASTNPRISVKDDSDIEIVVIGDPISGFYGIEVKGTAGFLISGTGSAEVSGGGSVQVKGGGSVQVTGGGDITVDGGDIIVSDGQVTVNGTGGIAVNGGGNVTIGSGGDLVIDAGGNATITGALAVSGTTTIGGTTALGGTVTLGGDLLMGTSGLLRIGGATGKRIVWAASGMEAYDVADNRRMFLDVDTATWRFFGENAVVMEGDGSLKAGELAWVDAAGFWATDVSGNAAFGVSGLDTHLWGGKVMDKGDVMLGGNTSYVYWDASTSKLTVSGNLSAGGGKATVDDKGITLVSDVSSDEARPHYIKWHQPEANATHATIAATWNGFGGQSNLILHSNQPTSGADVMTQYWANSTGSAWLCWLNDATSPGVYNSIKLNVNTKGVSYTSGFVYTDGGLTVGGTETSPGVGNILANGRFYPGGTVDNGYFGRWGANTPFIGGNTVIGGGMYPGNQGSYFVSYSAAATGLYTNGGWLVQGNLYVGNQVSRYFHDDGTYTRYQGNFVVDGDLYMNGWWMSSRINQALLTTSNVNFQTVTGGNINMTGGGSTFGNTVTNYLPTSANWSTTTSLIVQGFDYSSIGFHDAGSRVDFIVGGGGILRLGYDGGWGAALCTIPGGARVGATGVYIGNTTTAASYLIHLSSDSAGKPNGGSWTNSSDRRLKTLEGDYTRGLDDLRRLNPIWFRWNGKLHADDGVHAGFIAQEVLEIAPEMVSTIKGDLDGEETDILQLNLSDLPLMLRNAVVQLADEVADLRAEVAALRGSA